MWTVVGEGVSLPELPAPGAVPLFLSLYSEYLVTPGFHILQSRNEVSGLPWVETRSTFIKFTKSSGLLGGSVG